MKVEKTFLENNGVEISATEIWNNGTIEMVILEWEDFKKVFRTWKSATRYLERIGFLGK